MEEDWEKRRDREKGKEGLKENVNETSCRVCLNC